MHTPHAPSPSTHPSQCPTLGPNPSTVQHLQLVQLVQLHGVKSGAALKGSALGALASFGQRWAWRGHLAAKWIYGFKEN